MDFHPPQGAHTSYLRTLSKISKACGTFFVPRPRTFRPREPHILHRNSYPSTPREELFSSRPTGGFSGRLLRRLTRAGCSSKGRASYIHLPFRQHPARKIFLPRDSRETPSLHGHGPATKGRESYNQSAIRQPLRATTPRSRRPQLTARSGPPGEGRRILQPRPVPSSPGQPPWTRTPSGMRGFPTATPSATVSSVGG